MTTIFCNNEFMIADKRTTIISKGRIYANDDAKKITLTNIPAVSGENIKNPLYKRYLNLTVKAIGFAGSAATSEAICSVIKKGHIPDLVTIRELFLRPTSAFVTETTEVSYCVLFNDGSFESSKGHSDNLTVFSSPRSPKHPVSVGSGSRYITTIREIGTVERLHILEEFLYCVYKDPCSSLNYDVYSLQEDKLVHNCTPTKESVHEISAKVLKSLRSEPLKRIMA